MNMMKLTLLTLWLRYFCSGITTVDGIPYPSNATVTSKIYYDGEGGFDFIDVSGNLSDILANYTFEIIVSGLGFGEGPKWIQDCSYENNGYMLVADQYSDCIWRYYTMSNGKQNIECIYQFDLGTQPNAVGWNLNFPDEIYIALQGGSGIARLNLTSLTLLNRWNQSIEGYKLWLCNDIIMDSQGMQVTNNVVFRFILFVICNIIRVREIDKVTSTEKILLQNHVTRHLKFLLCKKLRIYTPKSCLT